MRDAVLRALRLAWLVAIAAAAAGCATVRPWEREHLARPAMVADQGPGEERFQQHSRGAREGADGGTGQAGGGCGCN